MAGNNLSLLRVNSELQNFPACKGFPHFLTWERDLSCRNEASVAHSPVCGGSEGGRNLDKLALPAEMQSPVWPLEVVMLVPDPCLHPHLAQVKLHCFLLQGPFVTFPSGTGGLASPSLSQPCLNFWVPDVNKYLMASLPPTLDWSPLSPRGHCTVQLPPHNSWVGLRFLHSKCSSAPF